MSKDWTLASSGPLRGEVNIPGDKSISHRAIILGSLAKGETVIRGCLKAEDVERTKRAFSSMGIEIKEDSESVLVKGRGLHSLRAPESEIDCGNSGTTMRLLAGVLAGQNFQSVLVGDESLSRRPMRRIIEPLREMGAEIEGTDKDTAPLRIRGGKLKGISYKVPVASAQVKSCILLAGLYANGPTELFEPAITRDHTERMLEYFGVQLKRSENRILLEGVQEPSAREVDVPGDISSSAFFLVAGLLVPGSEILIKNVGINPTRTGILDILQMMNAKLEFMNLREKGKEPVADILVKSQELRGVKISGELVPRAIDEIPILCVAGALAKGVTEIRDAKELRVKESDRISTMASELRKFGVKVEELEDGLIIEGSARLKGALVQSYGDHRVAMALAIAGLVAEGETRVKNVECVATSFPEFFDKIQALVA